MGHMLKLKHALGTLRCAFFSFNKCPIVPHDGGANVKFGTKKLKRNGLQCSGSAATAIPKQESFQAFLVKSAIPKTDLIINRAKSGRQPTARKSK
jgi:hypothetical protein